MVKKKKLLETLLFVIKLCYLYLLDCFRTKALKTVTGLKNKIARVTEENYIKMQISSC